MMKDYLKEIDELFNNENNETKIKSLIEIAEKLKDMEQIKNGTKLIRCSCCKKNRRITEFGFKKNEKLKKTCEYCKEKYQSRREAAAE